MKPGSDGSPLGHVKQHKSILKESMRKRSTSTLLLIAVAMITFAVVWAVRRSQALPDGPRPIVWDREVCTECRMIISDHHHAAQLQTVKGDVLDFDTPECLFIYLGRHHPLIHAIYFRHAYRDVWLDEHEAAFLRSADSPMGREFEAVDRGTSASIPLGQALQEEKAAGLVRKEY